MLPIFDLDAALLRALGCTNMASPAPAARLHCADNLRVVYPAELLQLERRDEEYREYMLREHPNLGPRTSRAVHACTYIKSRMALHGQIVPLCVVLHTELL